MVRYQPILYLILILTHILREILVTLWLSFSDFPIDSRVKCLCEITLSHISNLYKALKTSHSLLYYLFVGYIRFIMHQGSESECRPKKTRPEKQRLTNSRTFVKSGSVQNVKEKFAYRGYTTVMCQCHFMWAMIASPTSTKPRLIRAL